MHMNIQYQRIYIFFQISSSLSIKLDSKLREKRDYSPYDWMINNSQVAKVLEHTRSPILIDSLIDHIKENSLDEHSGCIQLFLCKIKPFILEMQAALGKPAEQTGQRIAFKYIPSLEVIADNGDKCEKQYHYCILPV